MISIKNISKKYGELRALQDVSLDIQSHSFTSIIGTSGSGKTTLLRLLSLLEPPTEGSIFLNQTPWNKDNRREILSKIGYVIQDTGLLPHLTVKQNIYLPFQVSKTEVSTDIQNRAHMLAQALGLELETLEDRYPQQLSGGQKQRVAIIRALIQQPDILLMDEPFGALDALTKTEFIKSFIKLRKSLRQTVIMVTHDLRDAFYMSDQIALFHQGELQQVGKPAAFIETPKNSYVQEFMQSYFMESPVEKEAGI